MAGQVALSAQSMINLSTDTPASTQGTVTRQNGQVIISGQSAIGFNYDFETSGALSLRTQGLNFNIRLKAATGVTGQSRYNNIVRVLIAIQYYKEVLSDGVLTGYESGGIEQFNIIPYYDNETGGYIYSYDLETNSGLIQRIFIGLYNESESNTVTFYGDSLYYMMTVNEAISKAVGFDVSLDIVDWYPNGFKLTYSGDQEDRLYWNGDENDNLNGVDVNHNKLILSRDHTELLD